MHRAANGCGEPLLPDDAVRPNVDFAESGGAVLSGVWRPERRNRNIGTKSSGFSKSNDMRIPQSWIDKHGHCSFYYERLDITNAEEVLIGDHRLKVLYELPRKGFSYGCSPADAVRIIALAGKEVPTMPSVIAFRQPTRKQQQQYPVWGRFLYFAEFGSHAGTSIVLEAQKLGAMLKWPKNMTLEDRAEYNRLIQDGHSFKETKRHHETELVEAVVRHTMLYRTLLHELGHLADYNQKVLDKRTALDPDQEVAADLYFSRPLSEREAVAHAFAEKITQALRATGEIPFGPLPFE